MILSLRKVIGGPHGHGVGQSIVAYKFNPFRFEGPIPVEMVRVDVGVDHVAYGSLCRGLYSRFKALPLFLAAPGIDDGDTSVADDEADVGYLPMILRVR